MTRLDRSEPALVPISVPPIRVRELRVRDRPPVHRLDLVLVDRQVPVGPFLTGDVGARDVVRTARTEAQEAAIALGDDEVGIGLDDLTDLVAVGVVEGVGLVEVVDDRAAGVGASLRCHDCPPSHVWEPLLAVGPP
jgi:hypothetical protein